LRKERSGHKLYTKRKIVRRSSKEDLPRHWRGFVIPKGGQSLATKVEGKGQLRREFDGGERFSGDHLTHGREENERFFD